MRKIIFVFLIISCTYSNASVAATGNLFTQNKICTNDQIDLNKFGAVLLRERPKSELISIALSRQPISEYAKNDLLVDSFLKEVREEKKDQFEIRWSENCNKRGQITAKDFLGNRCVIKRCLNYTPPPKSPPQKPQQFKTRVAFRDNAANLRVPLDNATKDNSVTHPGTLTFTQDIENDIDVVQGKFAAGFVIDGHLTKNVRADRKETFDNPFTFAPYITYHRLLSSSPKANEINQLGAGLSMSFEINTDTIGNEFVFTTKYLSDDEGETSIIDGELIYFPNLSLDGPFDPLGGFTLVGPFSLYIEPSLHLRYAHIYDAGGNLKLFETKEYTQAGGKIGVFINGNSEFAPDFFNRLQFHAEYIWLKGFDGPLDNFNRFSASLDYMFGDLNNFGVGLNYTNGDIDTTFQDVEILKAALKMKF